MALSTRTIYQTETDLDSYQVIERIYSGRPARLLYTSLSNTAQSGIPLDDDDLMLFGYNQRLVELIDRVMPTEVLLIGGGVYTLPSYIYKYYPTVHLDIVEPDTGLEEIAKRYFDFRLSANSHIIHDRGLHYLKTSSKSYDLIIVDAFSGYEIPDEVMSRRFAKYAVSSLTEGGLLAANIISNVSPISTMSKIQQAYSKYFKFSEIFPAEADVIYFGPTNLVYVGSENKISVSLKYPALSGNLFTG